MKPLNTMHTDSDIVPMGQKYCVYSAIEPDDSIYDLFYSYAFDTFLSSTRVVVRNYLLDSDVEFDKRVINQTHERVSEFYNGDVKLLTRDLKEIDENAEKEFDEIEQDKIEMEQNRRKKIMKFYGDKIDISNDDDINKKTYEMNMKKELEDLDLEIQKRIDDDSKLRDRRREERGIEDKKKLYSLEGSFFHNLFKSIDKENRKKHEHGMEYILGMFKKFMRKNRAVLNERFEDKYDQHCHRLIKVWGVFKHSDQAKEFCKGLKGRAYMGRTYFQNVGSWEIYNPANSLLNNTTYMKKTMSEIMSAERSNKKQADDEAVYRREVLKEKEMRRDDTEYESYHRDGVGDIGKEVDKKKKKRRIMDKVSDKVLDHEFDYYNPRAHLEMRLKSKDDIERTNMVKANIKEMIHSEISYGDPSILNPEMMEEMEMKKELISTVRDKKKIAAIEKKHTLKEVEPIKDDQIPNSNEYLTKWRGDISTNRRLRDK